MPINSPPWLQVAAILIFAVMLFMAYRSVRQNRSNSATNRSATAPDPASDTEIDAAIRVSSEEAKERAARLGLVLALFFLSERIEKMRNLARALTLPDAESGEKGIYGPFAREKAIILEQIRIAASCRDEIAVLVHGAKTGGAIIDDTVVNAVKWPFTAANLQLSFAQKRLDSFYATKTD